MSEPPRPGPDVGPPHTTPRSAPGGSRPKIIYVMGAGRSGSTILGVALGNCAGVFFAGELDRWLARAGVPRRSGETLTSFWEKVLADVGDVSDLAAGRATCLERSSALLDVRRWPARRRLRPRYRAVSQELYRAIAATAGATHVVDTSHYPMRARELSALDGIELYLLYLVREPQSVVASLGRRDVPERTFGVFRANAYLWVTQALALLVFLRHPPERRIFVRHEDFLEQPERVLAQVLRQCESDATVPGPGELRIGLPFHGNRLIEADAVTLGRPERSVSRSRFTYLAQLPFDVIASRLRPAASAR